MDLDPGQPNYNLAGQLALLRIKDLILTNSDYRDSQIIKAYYLNTPTPNLNLNYYIECTNKLFEEYKSIHT